MSKDNRISRTKLRQLIKEELLRESYGDGLKISKIYFNKLTPDERKLLDDIYMQSSRIGDFSGPDDITKVDKKAFIDFMFRKYREVRLQYKQKVLDLAIKLYTGR